MKKPVEPVARVRSVTHTTYPTIRLNGSLQDLVDKLNSLGVPLTEVRIYGDNDYEERRFCYAEWPVQTVLTASDEHWAEITAKHDLDMAAYKRELAVYEQRQAAHEREEADEQRRADLDLLNKLCARYPDAVNKIANA